jgi:hypothetical protein
MTLTTSNYLKLKPHAKTRKLWKHSAGLPSLEAIPVDQFTSPPLVHFSRPPICALHYLRFPGIRHCTSPRARVALTIHSGAGIKSS